MSTVAIIACVWILLVSIVAMVPYPAHRPYALALLVLFPFLLFFVFKDVGLWWGLALFAGAASIFRHPLAYLGRVIRRKWRGEAEPWG